ncbi:T9SS type A sorting domain-containing protein [Schleiferiaceae bacterium]|jgi:thiol-disulfide isomerase/thioredoxin|nr:T9SS type A sorting domain-containing protein [Schleiferiaceae bacterium]
MKKILLSLAAVFAATGLMAQGQSVIYSENFDNGIPSTWTQTTNATDGGFLGGNSTSLSSQYFSFTNPGSNFVATNDDGCNCDKSNEYLITDVIDLSGYSVMHATFKSFYYGATYQGATEVAEFLYSTNGGATWTSIGTLDPAGDWETQWIDVTAACGNANVQFAFNYQDGGGWLYGLGIDDFALFAPYNFDVAMESLNMPTTLGLNNAPFTFEGTLRNYGGATITSATINYSVNGGTPVTESLSGLSIAPYDTYTWTHTTAWNPSTTGTYSVDFYALPINGTFDQNTSNDNLNVSIEVLTATADRVVLAEEFTSSTCGPCASFNPGYKQLLDANSANTETGRVTSVKYQMNWPSPGNDPAYNQEAADRRVAYGISGVPDVVYSGSNIPTSQANIDIVKDVPSLANLSAEWSATGNYIQCDATVNALADLGSNVVLHMAMIEKQINHSIQTNGETVFYHVFRKFMDGSNGHSMSNMTAGNTYTHYANSTISVNAAPAQGSFDFWIGTSNMDVIVWLQNTTTGEVLQSAYGKYTTSGINEMDDVARFIAVYPNPSNEVAGIELDLIDRSDVTLNLVNSLGQTVYTSAKSLDAGIQKIEVSTASLSAGLYFINVNVDGISKTLRLNVAH